MNETCPGYPYCPHRVAERKTLLELQQGAARRLREQAWDEGYLAHEANQRGGKCTNPYRATS